METFVIQLLGGLSKGMILFVLASGLSLIFGVMRVINFAHGSLYMLGAFLAASLGAQLLGLGSGGFVAMLLLVPLIVALVGVAMETTLFRRIYTKEHLLQLLLTYGLTLLLSDAVRMIWGGEYRTLRQPDFLRGGITILSRKFPVYGLFVLVIGPLIALGLWYLLNRTRWGRIIRAAVANPEMVSALGINTRLVFTGVFALGCWLAGLGGALVAGQSAVGLGMDVNIIVEAFAVVVIGGLGSFPGALLGALLIGLIISFGILIAPGWASMLPFAAMAVVLIVRPWGLLGKPER
jgi:branched-subunit amino acid ABC-type transport system permease component